MKVRESLLMSQVVLLAGGVILSAACTKGTDDKASLPPPKNTVADVGSAAPEAGAPQKTTENSAEAEAPKADAGTAAAPTNQTSSQAAAVATPPPAKTAAAQPGGPEPGRIAPSPANDLGNAVDYRLTGEVDATRKSQVAFRVPGILSTVAAKPGTVAKKGFVLASLDDRDYVLRLELAKAQRDQARVANETAQRELKREMELKAANASTPTVFERVKAAAEQARLSLKLTELAVEGAQLALKDTKLVAPYDSVVAAQLKYEGENVPSGTAVYEVFDTFEPEITLTVPERLLGQVTVGSKLTITIPSAGYSGPGDVIRQVPVINEKTRTFRVTVKLAKYDSKIIPGLYAEGILN
jgi:RND family efflux transporter MFP subunit